MRQSEATYTHYKLRVAYTSLCSNLDHLFTIKILQIYLTNHLNDRKFFDLKNRIKIYKGLPTKLKKK